MALVDASPCVIWLTGLSGAGKTTLATNLKSRLQDEGANAFVLDGDILRTGLCKDLGFSPEDRTENIRRAAHAAKMLMDSGSSVIAALISPLEADRQLARAIIGDENFKEVFVKCSLQTCESRDVKGLYKKVREGLVKNFTGISAPYEEPTQAHLVVRTDEDDIESCVYSIMELICKRNIELEMKSNRKSQRP
jgi:adenylylsulfate kinase